MTSWALLLLASALLATPGLTFSGLTPEDHDLDMADRCQDEKFFWMLAQETPQHNASLNLCGTCRLILNWLKNRMGQCRIQKAIKHAASTVCDLMFRRNIACKIVIIKFLRYITKGILKGKRPKQICVKLRMC